MANSPTPVQPDVLYLRSREDLLAYEDARINSLLQGMANYYSTRNDQSTWGNFLRALAIELAKLDYSYSYAIVNKNPSFLTPPDIKRRWADPLYVNSNWPSPTQFDTAYKLMLVDLIAAYHQGSTVSGIEAVIFAYTGIHIVVQELYKDIGNGVYDQSDRNAIKVSINVGPDSLAQITSLTQLQQIVHSLYGAIDLAKPAHVGLEFTTVFSEGEDLDCFISPTYLTAQQYLSDTLSQQGLYTQTGYVLVSPAIFWRAPTVGGSPPVITSNPYTLNTLLRDSNGNLQLVIVEGTPGLSVPDWNQTSEGITPDGDIVWQNISPQPTAILLANNVVTVEVPNIFTIGQQVTLLDLASADGFAFLNGIKLTVLSSNETSFTASFAHTDVVLSPPLSPPLIAQTQGTVGFLPAAHINLLSYHSLSSTYQSLYQEQYTNTNCSSTGINDILRIFVRQIELPPFAPMLIQAPVLNPTAAQEAALGTLPVQFGPNPTTTIAGRGQYLQPTIPITGLASSAVNGVLGSWDVLPSITFEVVKTASDGINLSYTFNTLVAANTLPLHEGERVTISGCTNGGNAFNVTGKIADVEMLTLTSGTFLILLPTPGSPIASAVDTGSGIVSPTFQSAYTLQGGQYVLLQVPPLEVGSSPPVPDPLLNPVTKWIALTNVDANGNLYYTGEISNWDISHQTGLVAPRLDQVWEVSGDQDFIFNLT